MSIRCFGVNCDALTLNCYFLVFFLININKRNKRFKWKSDKCADKCEEHICSSDWDNCVQIQFSFYLPSLCTHHLSSFSFAPFSNLFFQLHFLSFFPSYFCLTSVQCGPASCDLTCGNGTHCVQNTGLQCLTSPCCPQWSCQTCPAQRPDYQVRGT